MFKSPSLLLAAAVSFVAVTCVGMSHVVRAADDGFVALFNGQDLTGWQTAGDWFVDDGGVLGVNPKPGGRGPLSYRLYLWTEKKYADFVLDLEFKISEGGNSGVFLRANSSRSFIEVQIRDSHGKQEPLAHNDCGGAVYVMGPSRNMARPAGQWNRVIVTCKGSRLQVELNSQPVIDLDLAHSSTKSMPPSGKIGLQDFGHRVWFRNVRIKEL